MDLKVFVGNKIKELRKEKKITQTELAELLGTTKQTVSRYERGQRKANQDFLFKLCDVFDVTLDDFFPLEKNSSDVEKELLSFFRELTETRKDNVVNYASNQYYEQNRDLLYAIAEEDDVEYVVSGRRSAAGTAIEVDDSLARQDVMPSSMVPKGADELVEITGDSMEPLIMKGTSVYIRHQPTIENGEIAIISILDAGVTCKHVCFDESGKIVLKSENGKYADMVFDADQIRIIGKVLLK